MAIPQAKKTLMLADGGKLNEVTAELRRHAIEYLMFVEPDKAGTADLSERFGVTDSMIRRDKRQIREQRAKALKEDDVGLIIADINIDVENQIRDIERCKADAKNKGIQYAQMCKMIVDIRLKATERLQSLGYYPKNIGTQITKEFKFVAQVSDGGTSVRHVDQIIEGELAEPARRDWDAEFPDGVERPALAEGKSNGPEAE